MFERYTWHTFNRICQGFSPDFDGQINFGCGYEGGYGIYLSIVLLTICSDLILCSHYLNQG